MKRILKVGMLILAVVFCGCGIEKTDNNKVRDLDYEMVEEEEVPEELKARIEEKKAADFKLTFESDNYLYVVRGYGEQETGGYSIQIADLYLTKNAIVFDTNLAGPAKDELKTAAPSYPYLVIRTQNLKKNVIFQ